MGTPFASPERPNGYRQDPLSHTQGGVRAEGAEIADMLGLVGGLSGEAQQLILEEVPKLKEICHGDSKCVISAIKKVSEASSSMPKGWTHADMLSEMHRRIEAIENGELNVDIEEKGN